jgi:DNA-binding response OmpR family regulator
MGQAAVVVVEDDYALARSLERSLASAGHSVLRLYAEELNAYSADEADVLVLAARDSSAAVQRLRPCSGAPIVVVGAESSLERRVALLDAGADDVMSHPFAFEELDARLRALRRGRALAHAQAVETVRRGSLAYADVVIDQDAQVATRGNRTLPLRLKAYELLAHFVRHPECVQSRRDLLREVWGFDFLGDSNVIDVTVSELRRALESAGEPRLIHTVRPLGYIFRAA